MDTCQRPIVTAESHSNNQSPSGAHLIESQLGNERQRSIGFAYSTPGRRTLLLRQCRITLLSAAICCCVFAGLQSALAIGQDPPPGQDPPAESKPPEKEDKPSPWAKDVQNIRDLEIPESQLKELYRGTRAHRKADPALLKENYIDAPKLTSDEQKRFDELRKQEVKKPEDLVIVEKAVRRQVCSLSQRQQDWYLPSSEGRKNREAMETMLDTGGGATDQFLATYKGFLIKHIPVLLNNHIWVRINAMKVLSKVRDERAIKLFCDQIQDPSQHESVKYMAIEGLESLGARKLIRQVNLETLAVSTLLDVLASDVYHAYTRLRAVRALGAIGRANRVIGGNDVDVAVALLKIIRDPNVRRGDRNDAVLALANLEVSQQAEYNYQYVAFEVARFAADVAAAALEDPTIDDLHSHLYLVDASYALVSERRQERMSLLDRAKKNQQANAKADPIYIRILGEQVTKLTVAALKVYKPEIAGAKAAPAKAENIFKKAQSIRDGLRGEFATQLNELQALLKSKPPRSLQLTPHVNELGPPPALVGTKASAPAEQADGNRESVETIGSAAADRPDQ